jgi:hypothetical protein
MRLKAAKLLERAFKADENNPLVLKYLSDYYFLKKNYKLSQKLSERGLQVLEPMRHSEAS